MNITFNCGLLVFTFILFYHKSMSSVTDNQTQGTTIQFHHESVSENKFVEPKLHLKNIERSFIPINVKVSDSYSHFVTDAYFISLGIDSSSIKWKFKGFNFR